jgi:hypothetical protein
MNTTATTPLKGESAAMTAQSEREPLKLVRRIGSTDYTVSIHFNKKSKETLEDKILRLIELEVNSSA